MRQRWSVTIFAMLSLMLGAIVTQGQEQGQAITITLPPFAETILDEAIVDDFEAQTGVPVEFIYRDSPTLGSAPQNSDAVAEYTDDIAEYMASADVVLVDNFLIPEITRAGYILDLTPLISADPNMNPADFYNTAWNAFTWDGSMWAVPIAGQPLMIDYNITAFDEAGLTYPNANWTLNDIDFAIRELAQYDETGAVTLPGMIISDADRNALFRSLLTTGFYDGSSFPSAPFINNSELAILLETWQELVNDGVVQSNGAGLGAEVNNVAMRIGNVGSFTVTFGDGDDDDGNLAPAQTDNTVDPRTIASMPNGQTTVLGTGLAISSGSTISDVAYQLVSYLSQNPNFTNIAIGSEQARRNITTTTLETDTLSISFGADRTPEEQALITDTMDTGLPMSELRFSQYINSAFNEMQTGTDSITALQEAEVDAVETLQAMDDTEVNLTVTSGLPLEIGAGEVVLSFGFQSFIQPLPNQAEWDEAIAGFVAQDSQVGAVDLDIINIAQSLLGSGDTETYDCTYYPNTLFVDIDSELLLPLDPLIFSDPNYDVADLPFGALELTQLNGITYGLPITIQPQMLQYNPDTFAQAGVPEPIGGWTISEFGDALAALDEVLDDDVAPFTSLAFDNTYLLMLVASQGGLPIDTRTNPPTLDFTSDATLSAVELVLEWVDAGYIDQTETGGPGGGGAGFVLGSGESPITPTFFTGFSNPDLNFTTYPSGSTFTPLAFDVGAGYISIDSDIPEACFRWLSYMSRQPELFTGAMPAQVSLIDRPEVQESLGQDTLEAYRTIASQMNEFNVVNFNATDPFLTTWLTRAMETYLAEDIELRPELEDAQLYTSDYLACTANIELELNIQLFQDLTACVEQVEAAIID